jgi:hypothetical protein
MVLSNGKAGTVVYAKYSNDPAPSLANDCQAGDSGGGICSNFGPLTQADGSANGPINLQISNPAKDDPQGPPGPERPQGPKGE